MATISDAFKVNAIKQAIKSAQLKGLSGASVLNRLKGTSLAIREGDFYRLARDVRQDTQKIQALWELDRNQVVTPDYALTAKAKFNVLFSFTVHVAAYDVTGRYLYDTYKTVNTNVPRTKGEVLNVFAELRGSPTNEEQSWYPYDVVEARYYG